MYILFQNYIGKVTGIAHVGITGSAVGAIAMVGQAGGVAGTSAVIGQAGGIAGTTAGQAGSAASAAVTGQAGGATGAAAKASAHGIAKFLGTVGGKVAVGVVGVAAVVGIGLGIHPCIVRTGKTHCSNRRRGWQWCAYVGGWTGT